ncbi:hypothetical protein MPSEU_000590100 [Mayamaea pseudoterrestris]|nr:hypothetical protein MPSEU_000590100 [Mayamaea pseudoterrestris]
MPPQRNIYGYGRDEARGVVSEAVSNRIAHDTTSFINWSPICVHTVYKDRTYGRKMCVYAVCLPGGSLKADTTRGLRLQVTDDNRLMVQVPTPDAFQSTDLLQPFQNYTEMEDYLIKYNLSVALNDFKTQSTSIIHAIAYLPLPFECTKEVELIHAYGDAHGSRIVYIKLQATPTGFKSPDHAEITMAGCK